MNVSKILFAIYGLKPHEYVKGFKMVDKIENQSTKDDALCFLRQLRLLANSCFGSYCHEHYVSGWS